MAKSVQLPDGSWFPLREGEDPRSAMDEAAKLYPDAFGIKKREEGVKRDTSGFKAAASASTSRLQGEAALTAAKLGLMDTAEAEKYYKAKEEEAKARFTPTEAGWTESPFLKFKETLGGSVPYMAAPAAAGIAALAAPVSAPAAAALGAAGAFGASAAQFTGTNIARQMDTGKSLEETSGAAAFGAAVPQALLDTAAMALMPGIGKLFGSVGEKLTVEQAKAIASQTLGRTVADYAAKTGTAMGREGITEATQQALERLQAGLSITDPDARKEYIDSFIGGAALAGAGAPIGRAFERGAAKEQAAKADKEEKAKAREMALLQQQQADAAEVARKQTPEYALDIAQQYDELQRLKGKLQAKIVTGKNLTDEDKFANKQTNAELQENRKQFKAIEAEYHRTAPVREQALEQQRVEAMSPEDFMLEQVMQGEGVQAAGRPRAERGALMPLEKAQPTPPDTSVADYAAGQLEAARNRGVLSLDETVPYLLQNPVMAQRMVQTNTQMPGLTRQEDAAVLGAIKLHLKEMGKAQTAEAADKEERLRTAMAGQAPGAELLGGMREQPGVQAAQEERATEDRRLGKVLPEVEALRRIAEKPTAPVRDEDQLATQVDALVDALLKEGPAPAGRVVAGTTPEAASKADTLRAQLSYAQATDNRERANELKKQLADLNEPETEQAAGDIEFGQASKEAGVEGRLSQDAMRANRVTRLSNHQLAAFDRLADFVQRVREGGSEVSDARKQTLTNVTERLKEAVVGLALNEIDARRAQAGMPVLELADKVKAVGQLNQTLDELIERGAGLFQKTVATPAKTRGTLTLQSATEKRQPVGRRVFNDFAAAAKALRGHMREDIDRIGGFVEQEAKIAPERKFQKAETLLRTQWQNATERELAQQFAEAKKRAKSEADVRTLDDMEAKFDKLSDEAKDEVVIQISRVENGLPLEVRGALKDDLADLRAAGVSETGQTELFPGESEKAVTRSTPARFMALLGSKKIAQLKAKLAEENRVLEFQAKRAATIEAKAKKEAADAEAFQQKLLESKAKSPVQQAKDALAKLTGPESKATQATQLADQIVTQRNAVRTRLRAMISQIEDSERKAKAQVKDIQALYDYTNTQLENLQTNAAKSGVAASMNELAQWTAARDGQETELKKAQKTLDAVQKSLAAARDTLARVTEDHASDVLDNSIIREGEKAQRKIDAAKAALEKAQADERAAARVLAAEKEKRKVAAGKTDKERLEDFATAAGAEVTRVYRDTSDAGVQAKVTAERKNIARAEEAHDAAKAAGDKVGMELALKQIEAAYDKVYEILNNAPMRRETLMTDAQVKAQEAYDKAQTDVFEATIKAFEEQAGVRPLKMTKRRTVASVKNVKTGRIETQFKQESVAAQEARVKQEEATGQYPARALEELAKARAEFAEAQRQLDYIKANPAAPRSEAKKRQDAARVAAKAKQGELATKIKQLVIAQQAVVKEAKIEKQAEKALRQEKQRMVRSAGRLQEAVGETDEGSKYLFSRGTPPQGLTASELRRELDAAVGDEGVFGKKVSVYDSVDAFLATNKKYRGDVPADAKAFVDPETGRAYMFAENIAKGEGLGILLHEVGVHIGFRNFFSAGEFNALVNAVRAWEKRPANSLEGRIARAATKRVADAATPAAQVDDELLAYAVEEAVKAGVEPAGTSGGSAVQNWLRRIVDAFKSALEKLGLAPETLTAADLVNMAYGAAQLELKGTWHGTGKLFREFDHTYMGSGEGAQAFSWGTYRAETRGVAGTYQSLAARKQYDAWLADPTVAAWAATQQPKFGGYTADDFSAFSKNGTPGEALAGVPYELAGIMKNALKAYAKELPDSPDEAPAETLRLHLRYPVGTHTSKTHALLREWLDNNDLAEATAPSTEPLYKGYSSSGLFGTNTVAGLTDEQRDAARMVLSALERDKSIQQLTGKQKVEAAIKVADDWFTDAVDVWGNEGRGKEYAAQLAELRKMRVSDFAHNPPTPAPVPRPTGVMLRTLHGRREAEYLHWDLPLDEQPDNVQKALHRAIADLTAQQTDVYNAVLAPLQNKQRVLKAADIYGALGAALESERAASERLHRYGIAGTKFLDRPSRGKPITNKSTFNYVDYADKEEGAAIMGSQLEPVGPAKGLLFAKAPAYSENALSDLANKIVAQKKTFGEQLKEIKALELAMAGADARAALDEVLKRGAAAMGDDTAYKQAMYLVRKRDDLLTHATAAAANGAPELFKDEKGFIGVRTSGRDSGVDVFEAVGQIPAGSAKEKFALASAYLIARRAANKGLQKLDTGALGLDQAELDAALAAANADPAMRSALENVARRYNAYNSGLIKFLVDTGAITKEMGKELLSKGDYIPFYRVRANGVAELVFSDKMVFTVGDIRNQPYLAELKGGEEKIMPLNESLMRNTLLLVDKGLTNLAERNVAYALQDIGKGQGPIDPKTGKPKNLMAIHTGDGPDDASVIRFTQEPDPSNPKDDGKRWLRVESEGTAIEGVPAELVVKSLEGASLPLPGFLKVAGAASDLLRTGITRTPLYIARQIYKESMAATFTGGLNYGPFRAVLEAGKEYGRMMAGNSATQAKLLEKGLMQSQIFSGSPDDLHKVALQLAKGGDQSTINKVFGWLDKAAMNADAATRALVYENARKNGLSEVEAEHMAREYMNFSKRGSNAAVQYASRLIPFMNAQIQSLNVLYKAMTGKMPFEEALSIKRKFYNNAMLLFATGLVYAMAMEDDEYFKNARPRDKYTNFFLHLPGVEEPIKIATPFEAGYFFSLAVAAVDGMKRETNNAEQFAALRDLFLQSIPGYSSMGVPQIVKPVFEVWTNKNFFTGAPIESLRLKNMDITERYTESTTEMAKALSKAVPILSPIQIEHIVRGYLGIAPLAAAAMINGAVPGAERGERPTTRASDLPLIGSAFQRKMGGAQADEVYDLAEAAFQSRTTFNTMLKEGRKEEAKAYREENRVELASAIDAGQYRQLVGRINSDIRRTQNRTDLTGDEKRARIDRLEDAKLKAAKDFITRYRAREDRLGG